MQSTTVAALIFLEWRRRNRISPGIVRVKASAFQEDLLSLYGFSLPKAFIRSSVRVFSVYLEYECHPRRIRVSGNV